LLSTSRADRGSSSRRPAVARVGRETAGDPASDLGAGYHRGRS
jgi:hypothetical protein